MTRFIERDLLTKPLERFWENRDTATIVQSVADDLNAMSNPSWRPLEAIAYAATLRPLVENWNDTAITGQMYEPYKRTLTDKRALLVGGQAIQGLAEFVSRQEHGTRLTDRGREHTTTVPLVIGKNKASQRGRNAAYANFLTLVESPDAPKLALCWHCHLFWARKRLPRKLIKGGVFCEACKPFAAARRRDASRAKRDAELVLFAAHVLLRARRQNKEPDSKTLAAMITRELRRRGRDENISGHQVTMRLARIKAAVEEIARAKEA